MSNLLEQASLVLIPSGYAEDIVYSEIPLDGSGDMVFTRASNGTRINSAGLVEVVPWNLFTYSEQPNNADWAGGGGGKPTMTDNFATAPNGTTTASKMEVAGSGYQLRQNVAIENTQMTISVWLRTNTGTKTIRLILNDGVAAYLDITVTTTWTRYEVSGLVTTLSGSGRCGLQTMEALTSGAYILVWGLQLNIGSTAKNYFPTTDRLNVPRLTYQNGGGGCPSLLLEKQSTNTITYSEDITNSLTSQSNTTVTANDGTSPDGTQNADLIAFTGSNAYRLRNQTVAATTTYTMSLFVKNNNFASSEILYFNMSDGVIGGLTASINVFAKTATYAGAGGAWTAVSGKVEDYGNGWFRVSVTGTSVSGGGGWYEISTAGITRSCYVWGLSLEISSYPTSYIPTTSASATRVADACFKTGISSLIGQTSGTIFLDVNFNLSNQQDDTRLVLSDGSTNNWIFVGYPDGGVNDKVRLYVSTTTTTVTFYSTNALLQGRNKIACGYQSGNFVIYLNGVLEATNSTAMTIPTCSNLTLEGSPYVNSTSEIVNLNQVAIFPTRLTNAELASLTTL